MLCAETADAAGAYCSLMFRFQESEQQEYSETAIGTSFKVIAMRGGWFREVTTRNERTELWYLDSAGRLTRKYIYSSGR